MVKGGYVPARGDVAWVSFDPALGHEQAGKRPAVIVSPRYYNAKAGMALACPVTTRVKGYPFEVAVRVGKVEGVALVDQIRAIDWQARRAAFAGRLSAKSLATIQELITKLVNDD